MQGLYVEAKEHHPASAYFQKKVITDGNMMIVTTAVVQNDGEATSPTE